MKFITKALNKLFKSSNQLELNKIQAIVAKINEMEKNFSKDYHKIESGYDQFENFYPVEYQYKDW